VLNNQGLIFTTRADMNKVLMITGGSRGAVLDVAGGR
jgi:hypothetical protein